MHENLTTENLVAVSMALRLAANRECPILKAQYARTFNITNDLGDWFSLVRNGIEIKEGGQDKLVTCRTTFANCTPKRCTLECPVTDGYSISKGAIKLVTG